MIFCCCSEKLLAYILELGFTVTSDTRAATMEQTHKAGSKQYLNVGCYFSREVALGGQVPRYSFLSRLIPCGTDIRREEPCWLLKLRLLSGCEIVQCNTPGRVTDAALL